MTLSGKQIVHGNDFLDEMAVFVGCEAVCGNEDGVNGFLAPFSLASNSAFSSDRPMIFCIFLSFLILPQR